MSSFLCFICHSTVSKETNEETRDKYREVIGLNLCPDSQLCYICCHVLNKLSLFRSICLKRSLEYPVLFREKGTLNLQKSDLELNVLCPEDCNQYQRSKIYQFTHDNDANDTNDNNDNEYVKLEHENDYNDYFRQCQYQKVKNNDEIEENNYHCKSKNVNNFDFTQSNYINEALVNDSNDIHEHSEEENDDTDAHDYCEVENNEKNTNLNRNEQIIEDLNTSYKNINNETETEQKLVNDIPQHEDFIDKTMEIDEINVNEDEINENEATDVLKKKKVKKRKKQGFKKIILSLEEQKAELEANRKGKKYIESEFKCYNCALGFLFKDTYQAHMMRHEESNGQHQCETCTLRFSTLALLRAHMANHKEIYICTKCGLNLRPRAQRGHNCTIKEVETVSCHLCGNLFKDASGLQQHIRRVHTRKCSGRLHSCGACGDGFSTQRALRTHMIKHVSHTFACSQCGAQFRSPYSRAAHEREHARAGRAHACPCGALFASRKGLVEHRRRSARHQSVLFECPICGRICPTQRALSSHMQTIHGGHGVQLDTGVPVNTGVQLDTRVQLDTGVQMDTGIQTDNEVQGVQIQAHTCPLCPARYTTRKSLLRHIRGHSGKSDVKMAVCHLCGNSFKGNSKLNRHLKEVCEKAKLEEEISALYE